MQAGSITGIRRPLCVCKSPTRAIATWITNEVSCRIVFHLRGNHLGRLLLLMSRVCFPPVATVRSLSPRTRGRHDAGNGTLFCQMSKQKQSDSKAAACPRLSSWDPRKLKVTSLTQPIKLSTCSFFGACPWGKFWVYSKGSSVNLGKAKVTALGLLGSPPVAPQGLWRPSKGQKP